MSLETWKAIFEYGGVILLFLTFVSGAGVVITTNRINERQAEQLREFDRGLTDAKTALSAQETRATEAETTQKGVETELAKQKAKAADAERALLELQTRLAHRRISLSERAKMVALLEPFRSSVVRIDKIADAEAARFADDVIEVFNEAGWSVELSVTGIPSPPRYGIICGIDKSSPAGLAVGNAIKKLPLVEFRTVEGQRHVATIIIGLKPPP